MHGQPLGQSMSMEMFKTFFDLIHDALVETNETIKMLASDTDKKFNRIVETQDNLAHNMMMMKTEVTSIKEESKEAKNTLAKLVSKFSQGTEATEPEGEARAKENRKENTDKKLKKKQKVAWVGTSLSKQLDKGKFEKDLNVVLTLDRAYCIKEETDALFKHKNFKAVVPKVIENDDIETLVLQTGSIEITNIDVNNAVNNPTKHIEDAKKGWFDKVEKDSTNLFEVAEEALKNTQMLKRVIIVKRLPRYDTNKDDILGIKSQLSEFANTCYDQLWVKRGRPNNIHIVQLEGFNSNNYLRKIVYGETKNRNYDGVHLGGQHTARHFTYRAVQAVKSLISKPFNQSQDNNVKSNHRNSPQTQYQSEQRRAIQRLEQPGQSQRANFGHQSVGGAQGARYSDIVKGKNNYSVPVGNRFEVLGN